MQSNIGLPILRGHNKNSAREHSDVISAIKHLLDDLNLINDSDLPRQVKRLCLFEKPTDDPPRRAR